MAPRPALLIAPALALLVAAWRGTPMRARGAGCRACHAARHGETGRCTTCHRGDPAATRKELAHHRLLSGRVAGQGDQGARAIVEGRLLVERLACRRCHVVGAAGNRLATELDRVVWSRDQAQLLLSIAAPVENMPSFGLAPRQREAVAAFLLRSAGARRPAAAYRVRFAEARPPRDSVFAKRCGGCHRALGARGPLGRGTAGPNLSGLFTAHYPPPAAGGRRWTEEALARWLENPRRTRPLAEMRPVRLTAPQRRELAEDLGR